MIRSLETTKRPRLAMQALMASLTLDVLNSEKGVLKGKSAAPLHIMRSRANRLRTAIRLIGLTAGLKKRKEWLNDLKWLTGVLGPARDLDVSIHLLDTLEVQPNRRDNPGIQWVRETLVQKREQRYDTLRKELSSKRWKGLKKRLKRLADSEKSLWLVRKQLEKRSPQILLGVVMAPPWAQFKKRHQTLLEQASPKRIHDLRKAGKRVRYVLEYFRPYLTKDTKKIVPSVAKLHDTLGNLHDFEVLEELIHALVLDLLCVDWDHEQARMGGALVLLRQCQIQHAKHMDHFHDLFREIHKPDELFDQMEKLVRASNSDGTSDISSASPLI